MQVFFSKRCPLIQGDLPLLQKILYTNGKPAAELRFSLSSHSSNRQFNRSLQGVDWPNHPFNNGACSLHFCTGCEYPATVPWPYRMRLACCAAAYFCSIMCTCAGTWAYFCTVLSTFIYTCVPMVSLVWGVHPVTLNSQFALGATLYFAAGRPGVEVRTKTGS